MTRHILPDRLRYLRLVHKLSQHDLAAKAGLSKTSIYRLETGRQPGRRQRTIDGLAKALNVDAGVLTGELPLPALRSGTPEDADTGQYQINVRVDGAVRNAFQLAAQRYRVPMARIVELAPFLFVLAAESSLERRGAKLAELEALFKREEELQPGFPHLPLIVVPNFEAKDALIAESESIEARDILASGLPDDIFDRFRHVEREYDEGVHNPFVLHLREAASAGAGGASIQYFDRSAAHFSVCREDAMTIAGGDRKLAERIMQGWAMLHEMPRELASDDAAEARIAWLNEKVVEQEARLAELYLAQLADL
jgi:transcriptional regulator with XRE-family HTH domain